MMDAEREPSARRRIDAERRLLAALCQGALEAGERGAALARLASYRFAEPEHEIVFREAVRLRAGGAGERRAELAKRLTRAGFPDVELERFFDCEPPRTEEFRALLRELAAG
jgi:hypothetical protein